MGLDERTFILGPDDIIPGLTMNVIFERVSVRDYSDQKIDRKVLEYVLNAAMNAPSAMNQQAWEFLVVDEKDKLMELAKVSPYATPVTRAPAAIVVLGNRDRMKVPQMWEQDLGACTENLLLGATASGLGAVWIGIAPIRDRMNMISDIFDLDENLLPFAVVAIGHPKSVPEPHKDRFDASRIHYNEY